MFSSTPLGVIITENKREDKSSAKHCVVYFFRECLQLEFDTMIIIS